MAMGAPPEGADATRSNDAQAYHIVGLGRCETETSRSVERAMTTAAGGELLNAGRAFLQ